MNRYQTASELANSKPGWAIRPLLPEPNYQEVAAGSRPFLQMVTAALVDTLADYPDDLGKFCLHMSKETATRVARSQEVWNLTNHVWTLEDRRNHAIDIAGRMLYGLKVVIADSGVLPTGAVALARMATMETLWLVEDVFK